MGVHSLELKKMLRASFSGDELKKLNVLIVIFSWQNNLLFFQSTIYSYVQPAPVRQLLSCK